jgi:regulator of replication initiation timing
MKDRLIELMKTNLDLVESSIQLYIENQKLRSRVALLQEKYEQSRKDKDRFLRNLSQNKN